MARARAGGLPFDVRHKISRAAGARLAPSSGAPPLHNGQGQKDGMCFGCFNGGVSTFGGHEDSNCTDLQHFTTSEKLGFRPTIKHVRFLYVIARCVTNRTSTKDSTFPVDSQGRRDRLLCVADAELEIVRRTGRRTKTND